MRLKKSFVTGALLVVVLGISSLALFAQESEMVRIGKKGEIAFDSPVRIGDVLLKAGTYRIQHIREGDDHVIVFRKIYQTGLGYVRSESSKDSAKVKCRIEPLGEKAKHDGLRFGTNAAGEKTVEEVHVKGENVKHLF